MSLSIAIQEQTIKISGNTYDHREYFKTLGGKWDGKTKSWLIIKMDNREKELNEYIKKHKKVRRCGFCGESGHNRTKCAAYAEKLKQDKIQLAIAASKNLIPKFQMLKHTPYCSCSFEEVHECSKIWKVPKICTNCHLWCCGEAKANPASPNNQFDFICPRHGSSMENMLNDTRGT